MSIGSWELPEGLLTAEYPVAGARPDGQETSAAADRQADCTIYRFSSLPPDTALEQLIVLAHTRGVIELYEDAV